VLPHEHRHALDEIERQLPRRKRRYLGRRDSAHRAKERVAKNARALRAGRENEMRLRGRADAAQRRLDDPGRMTGPDHEVERGLSKSAYFAILLVVGAVSFAIDRGSMLSLLLPLGLTTLVAVFVTVAQLLAAHFAGHTLRREHHSISPAVNLGRFERQLARVCFGLGIAVAVTLAAIRTAGSGPLTGVLFGLVAVLAFVVAVFASYMYSHDGVSALERCTRSAARASRLAAQDMKALLKAIAIWRSRCESFIDDAGRLCLFVDHALDAADDAWQRNHPGQSLDVRRDFPWLSEARLVSTGTLPTSLDVTDVLVEAGIEPAQVL
jgi:hypothetical protein